MYLKLYGEEISVHYHNLPRRYERICRRTRPLIIYPGKFIEH